MRKVIIMLIMLVASAAMFAEFKSMKYSYMGYTTVAYFNDKRTDYFSLAEIADYETPYLVDYSYEFELLDTDSGNLYEQLLHKLPQDICSKYNYVLLTGEDLDEDDILVEVFLLNSRDDICARLWRATAK